MNEAVENSWYTLLYIFYGPPAVQLYDKKYTLHKFTYILLQNLMKCKLQISEMHFCNLFSSEASVSCVIRHLRWNICLHSNKRRKDEMLRKHQSWHLELFKGICVMQYRTITQTNTSIVCYVNFSILGF